ncbi:MAG: tRNA uridine-5-carboxymethylaminomethyl(34) synthesis GTPase MnmE [Endomicrobiia bacterium]
MKQLDTIVAISTPLGIGGIGIVRLSGPKSLQVAEKIFFPKNKSKVISQLKTFTIHLGYIKNNDGNIIDEALLMIMRAPHSYTCEDVVEFSCHGGPVILKQVVELCLKNGARLAEPGEFTKRAFLNGRIDLSQAEAVMDLISSKSVLQNKIFACSLLGKTKENVQNIVEELKLVVAEIEATIDYPEEDDVLKNVNYQKIKHQIENLISKIKIAIENSQKILPIISGINIAIVGKVNVGKSSLLNVLLNHERAIVSDIPGTTRDTISEVVNIKNVPVRIVDTAGIRQHTQNVIEEIGIKRTYNAIKESDVIIFLLDATQLVNKDDEIVAETIISSSLDFEKKKVVILVVNKVDSEIRIFDDEEKIYNIVNKLKDRTILYPEINKNESLRKQIHLISCKTQQGIKELEQRIVDSQNLGDLEKKLSFQETEPNFFISNLRQLELIKNSLKEIQKVLEKDFEKETEIVAEHLKNAIKELQKITGGDLTEDVLDIIFSRFCVGK